MMTKKKEWGWIEVQLIFVILVLVLLNAIAPKPFKKHEQVECVNLTNSQNMN